MLRTGNLVRGDSSNLGHDVSLKCVLSIGNVLQCATAEGTRVGLSVLQEIPLTIRLPVRYQELFRLWDTIVHKSQKQFNQNPCPHGTCLSEGENISKCKLLPMCCVQFSSVQSLSRVRVLATPWITACQASLSITNSRSPPKPMLVMPSNHLILCRPLLLLPSIFPSIRVFSNESALRMRWPKYWSFSFSTNPSNEYSGLISSRMDWLDLLAVQGTLKSLLQHHSSKASILRCSAFFIVQLSYPCVLCYIVINAEEKN